MRIRSTGLAVLVSLSCGWIPAGAVEQTRPPASATVDPIHKAVEDANKFYSAGKYDDAAKVYQGAIKLTDKMAGPMAGLNRAILFSNLGTVYFAQKKFADAEQAYKSAIEVHKKLLNEHCAVVADTLQHYSALLRRTNRSQEADRWQNQADFLTEANQPGSNSIVDPPAYKEQPVTASFASSAQTTKPDTPSASIVRLVQMNASDKALLDNPTTVEKPVYRTEEYYEGGGIGFGGVVVGEKRTRQVLDHYESAPLSDAKAGLSYPAAVADLERSYRLSNSSVRTLIDAINSGGTALELGNGWLVVADETLDPSLWYGGMKVNISKTPEGNYALTSTDDKVHQTVKRLATKQ